MQSDNLGGEQLLLTKGGVARRVEELDDSTKGVHVPVDPAQQPCNHYEGV